MTAPKSRKDIFPLTGPSLLLGMLLSGCSEDLKITTKQRLPCSETPNSRHCQDLEAKEIQSLNTLQIDRAIITPDRKVSLSWTAAEEAKIIKNGAAILSKDPECKSEVANVWKEDSLGSGSLQESLQDVPDGIYYVCLSAKTTLGTKVAAANNGQRLVLDFSKPEIDASPEIIAKSNGDLPSDLRITDISNVSLSWQLVDDGSGAWLEAADTMMPRLAGAKAETYTVIVTATDEGGNTSSKAFQIISGQNTASSLKSPTVPSNIKVAAYSKTPNVIVSYTPGMAENFLTHNVKACSSNNCSTGCSTAIQDKQSPVQITALVNGSRYFICMQSVDTAGNSSIYVASPNSVTIDATSPTAPFSLGFSSSLSASSSVSVSFALGSDSNFLTHDVKMCAAADCSKSCTSVLQSATSPISITGVNGTTYYACARSLDLAANSSAWTSSVGTMTVDTTIPIAPSAVAVASYSNATSVNVSYTSGSDANFSTHNVKACTANDCSTGCLSAIQDLASPVTLGSLLNGTAYYACLQAVDHAGNTSAFVASAATVMIDTMVPGDPTAVSVPVASNGNVAISFTAGAETNPSSFNIKACTSGCTDGCVGATTTAGSPGTISGAAFTNGNSYHGCVQGTDLAGNSSNWVQSSGLVIFDSTIPNGASSLTVPSYSKSTSVAASFTVGTDANMSTHNFKACTSNDCSTGCLTAIQTSTSPANLTSLVNGTAYYACGQAVDLAGNTSGFSFTPATVTIDTTAPGNPSAVNVPAASASSFSITFTAGTETYPDSFNIKACTNSDCSTGCVGATTTASSPGTIASGALTLGTSYYGCVQGVDLATNTSSFVASAATVLYKSFGITYDSHGSTGGSVPTDAGLYASGATVTVLGNTGSLEKTGSTFDGWNTATDGTGSAYNASQTFSITANTTLYAQWSTDQTATSNSITGDENANTIIGSLGGDSLNGGAGDDIIYPDFASSDNYQTYLRNKASMVFWLDAADPSNNGSQPVNGSTLATWKDKSLKIYDIPALGGSAAWLRYGLHGRPALRFYGSQYYQLDYKSDLNATNQEVFVITQAKSPAVFRSPLTSRGLFTGYMFYANPSNQWQASYGNGGWSGWATGTTTEDIPQLLEMSMSSSNIAFSVGGSVVASAADYVKNSDSPLRVGAGSTESNANYYYTGDISEIIIFNASLTTQQKEVLRQVIANKYGLPMVNATDPALAADTLTGGAGADTFVWNKYSFTDPANRDIITDFNKTDGDKIDLSGFDPGITFHGYNGSFTSVPYTIIWSQSSGNTLVQMDRDGNNVADWEILLQDFTASTLTASDFIWPAENIITSGLVLYLDPAKANGSGFPGVAPANCSGLARSWKDLSRSVLTSTLGAFDNCGAGNEGWQGTGNSDDPYRLHLSGVGDPDRVTIAHNAELTSSNEFTWSLWFKTNGTWGTNGSDTNNHCALMGKHAAVGSCNGMHITVSPSGGAPMIQYKANCAGAAFEGTSSITNNAWHHLAVTFGRTIGNPIKIYIDGALSASSTVQFSWGFGTDNLLLGDSLDAFWEECQGDIGGVMIHNRALPAHEIKQNCKAHESRYTSNGDICSDF